MRLRALTGWPGADYNFDHPDAFDVQSMVVCLQELRVRPLRLPQSARPLPNTACTTVSTPRVDHCQLRHAQPVQEPAAPCACCLQAMRAVDVPIYDFATHSRSSETRHVEPADVVMIEGILVLHMEQVRSWGLALACSAVSLPGAPDLLRWRMPLQQAALPGRQLLRAVLSRRAECRCPRC